MRPHYTISRDIGFSGSKDGSKLPNVALEWIEQVGGKRDFNPFRDLKYGGTVIFWRGGNRYVRDKSFLGFFLKRIYE